MIEREEVGGGRKIRQAACNGQFAFGDLVGVREMNLSAMGDAGRTEGQFPPADFCAVNADRQTQSRSNAAMVKEITSVGLEIVDVENPPAIRKGDPELMFLVALSLEREEPAIVGCTKFIQRTSYGE